MKVAVIGSGISVSAVAHRLRRHVRVRLFEAGHHFGGHTPTVDVTLPDGHGQTVVPGVNTGILVFSEPGLSVLGVPLSHAPLAAAVEQCSRGATLVRFDAHGRVTLHRDYWDAAAEELYEKIPLAGALMRWLRQSACAHIATKDSHAYRPPP